MKLLHVIQHTSAEYLGLMEDHFDGRGIRYRYFRPFTEGTPLPARSATVDGLILLGGGPWGSQGERALPTLAEEVALTRVYLMSGKPVFGIGLGAQILALAADGQTEAAPLTFAVATARRESPDSLAGFMPESMPHITYMRDRPVPPGYAVTLSRDEAGAPAAFQLGDNVFGFLGHPGFKRAMAEDLIMEFSESPENPGPGLDQLTAVKGQIEDSLIPLMTGIIGKTGLMR
jgi:GMP synthase-like glutamine amidotransferase